MSGAAWEKRILSQHTALASVKMWNLGRERWRQIYVEKRWMKNDSGGDFLSQLQKEKYLIMLAK